MPITRTPRSKKSTVETPSQEEPIRVTHRRRVVANVHKQWFVGQLDDMGRSMRWLAEQVGLDIAAISLLFDGKRKMKASEAGLIAQHLGVPVEDVLRHTGVDVREACENTVSIKGSVNGQGEVTSELRGPATVVAPVGAPEGLLALRVVDGGLMHGWVLFCKETSGIRPEVVGKLCVITLTSGPRRVGWLRAGYAEGSWEIVTIGASTTVGSELNSVVSASPVMWIKP